MASTKGTKGDTHDFFGVNALTELNLGVPDEFPIDPISSQVATAKQLREAAEARVRAKAHFDAATKCDLESGMMSVLTVSGVVVLAIVAFFVSKKLKET